MFLIPALYLCKKEPRMERLDVFNDSNVWIASYFSDDCSCAHENNEHTLIYLCSGLLEIEERGHRTPLRAGECAFIRRDNRIRLWKHADTQHPYHSIALKFTRSFLREFYLTLDPSQIPAESRRDKTSLRILPAQRPDIRNFFESIQPCFETENKPSEEELKQKMAQGVHLLLETDPALYASLFDFVEPWKINILDYLNENYMYDLSMSQIAAYTGRSLATFKRDFAKVSELTPQKWILARRLEAARELIHKGGRKISEICFDVGFRNLSHFSKLYKATYGVAPSREIIPDPQPLPEP